MHDATPEQHDLAVIGAGAAGLMAAIAAGRALRAHGAGHRIIALDGAKKLGAKILVAGGGRCNVTHHAVSEADYAGWSRNAVKKVLRRFTVADTRRFFGDLGVELKREETGKLFPTTDRARTVLDALLDAAHDAGVKIRHPARVTAIGPGPGGRGPFAIETESGGLRARRVILATGGKALPRTGSDGGGYLLARALGHTITERVFPALVPLVLAPDHPLRALAGVTLPARIELRAATGKRLASFTNSTLCTHFGLSGPAVMDLSRHYTAASLDDPSVSLVASWRPDRGAEGLDREVQTLGKRSVLKWLKGLLPDRFAEALLSVTGLPEGQTGADLTKDRRRALVRSVCEMPLPVTGDRGFTHAEATAGGVPLAEVDVKTMASRIRPGLFVCGELCDVDGRIGGFNFQWAWATGHIAGEAAAYAILTEVEADPSSAPPPPRTVHAGASPPA